MAERVSNGAAIQAIRRLLGISQPEFAKRLGVSQGAISNIERGARNASPMMIRKIADELGVSLDAVTEAITEAVA
jgi:transcriptional regulator with XRE-family HTH domain